MSVQKDYPRRKSLRLNHYDYAACGAYFTTLTVWNREPLFGSIREGCVRLNDFGNIVKSSWLWLAKQYDHVVIDESVIMPDHFHGILWICLPSSDAQNKPLGRLLGAFKTVSSKHINRLRRTPGFPVWQRGFYERVIRNDRELYEIRKYIRDNPMVWEYGREITYPWL